MPRQAASAMSTTTEECGNPLLLRFLEDQTRDFQAKHRVKELAVYVPYSADGNGLLKSIDTKRPANPCESAPGDLTIHLKRCV
jgi:hypothetical protein